MNFTQTLDWLYQRLPMFQRVGQKAFKKDLSNTLALCKHLGNPERKYPVLHVAGTNGKGSSSHFLASIFQQAGYRTGLYTSPHLRSFTERIRVNGQEMDKEAVVEFVAKHQAFIENLQPSFFEVTVAMAFQTFADQAVDIAIIETGLGGRLDSTNVVFPVLSLITNIGFDHMDLLGDTLPKIAAEKAGIIKPNVPVVIGETHAETAPVFLQFAQEKSAAISFADQLWKLEPLEGESWKIMHNNDVWAEKAVFGLTGSYQPKNVVGVLESCRKINENGRFRLSKEHILKGLENVVQNTNIRGRWEKLAEHPLTYCDVGHNAEGVREVLRNIQNINYRELHMVWGTVKDKTLDNVLALLPQEAAYYFCEADIPRSLPVQELQAQAKTRGLKGKAFDSVEAAVLVARKNAHPKDLIFIGGSTFVVAEIPDLLSRED